MSEHAPVKVEPLDARHYRSAMGGASFPLRNRLLRALWNTAWLLLAAWMPAPFHAWRRVLLRLFGARIGDGARVYGSARVWYPPHLTMGDHAVLGRRANCYCQAPVVIEAHATVSQDAELVTGTHDIDNPQFQLVTRPIRIARHAWVAAGAFVGPGVTMGEGAVLGARAVAFSDLAPWTVYAGNPARVLRQRRR